MSFENVHILEPFIPRTMQLSEKEARISDLLRDFSSRDVSEEMIEILPLKNEMEPLLSCSPEKEISFSQHEMEAARLAAFASGLAQGKKEMQAALEQQFDEERLTWEEKRVREIEEVKEATITDLAGNWEKNLCASLETIKQYIEHDLAILLQDIVAASLTKEALDAFVAQISHEVIDAQKPFVIEGKQEFLDVFAATTQLSPEHYQLQPTSMEEIRLVLKDGVISTRLAPVMCQLKALI